MAHDDHHEFGGGEVSPDPEYAFTPPGAGYEHTDASVWLIVKFGLWLAVAAVVIHVGMWFAFGVMVQWREETEAEFPLAQGQEERLPEGARLQPVPVNDIYLFRRQEQSVLENYRWIDREGGRVQIPIADAMRLTVERGLPARAQQPEAAAPPAAAAAAPPPDTTAEPQATAAQPPAPAVPQPGFLPADSSAGRTLERRRQ
jgi:hypothetical protein